MKVKLASVSGPLFGGHFFKFGLNLAGWDRIRIELHSGKNIQKTLENHIFLWEKHYQ